ncbi:helix-turn-helix transcriptional regulator [Nocardia brasiliensis]|uniref:helix-turn-helix transcriptional regulator n=1 Tax=Nocardia brasiliensis TaxID=37326 RepID=UPI003D9331EC
MRDPSGRLLRLLTLLQSPREWSGGELAERLGVTVRTIRRDVDRLRDLGYPVHARHGNTGGYRLTAGTAMPPLVLDDEEAIAIAVGLRAATTAAISGIDDASMRALAKLEQVLPSRLRTRVTAVSQTAVTGPTGGPTADPEILAALAGACVAHEKVRFAYTKADGTTTKRFAEPHQVVAAGRRWYLLGFDSDRDDWRTFRLDRVSAVHRTGLRVPARSLPGGVDAATWLIRSLATKSGSVRARVLLHQPIAQAGPQIAARQGVLESIDESRCLLTTFPDTPQYLAYNIALLPMPYTLLEPTEVAQHLREMAERAAAATAHLTEP